MNAQEIAMQIQDMIFGSMPYVVGLVAIAYGWVTLRRMMNEAYELKRTPQKMSQKELEDEFRKRMTVYLKARTEISRNLMRPALMSLSKELEHRKEIEQEAARAAAEQKRVIAGPRKIDYSVMTRKYSSLKEYIKMEAAAREAAREAQRMSKMRSTPKPRVTTGGYNKPRTPRLTLEK